ncbi:GNAT family N-acetyltransferase [Desulfobacula toluolica]|uniref:GCN5-related N-acetyltransferase n=1 Tax=Desulfobacula toluolica (strain DSM 7467 / Tol2) TaxID=651182 RepID=K0NJL4_DESTT|nr:GNAT family N-acetyltransferase [Desulfobacula toluolica]CCK81696.1 GCN5-related N-acetyltransferase [Desulfobacula toluolica Tol2]
MRNKIQYCRIDTTWTDQLTSFFERIHTNSQDKYFHPHPFDQKKAQELCCYTGFDLYYVQTIETKICGYGMLRGWDQGYKIPSLGIIIHSDYRGRGLGKKFMKFLHEQAGKKGAKKIRLKVYPENLSAVNLYKKLEYSFLGKEEGQLLAFVEL